MAVNIILVALISLIIPLISHTSAKIKSVTISPPSVSELYALSNVDFSVNVTGPIYKNDKFILTMESLISGTETYFFKNAACVTPEVSRRASFFNYEIRLYVISLSIFCIIIIIIMFSF